MAGRIQLRRGTAANWTSANPTLAAGEVGVETDTGRAKVGNGSTAWTSLSYVDAVGIAAHEADTTSVHGIADTSTLYRSGGTDVAVADGGTGASTAAGAATNLASAFAADTAFYSRYMAPKSARVAIIGDSIARGDGTWKGISTDNEWKVGYLDWLAQALRNPTVGPGGRVHYVQNAGIGGNTTAQMLARFDTDITPYDPGVVVIGGGTNDTGVGTSLATFATNIRALVAKVRSINAIPVLVLAPPNDTTSGGRLTDITTFNMWLSYYAGVEGLPLIDYHSVLVDPADGTYLSSYTSDGTHPNAAGVALMATAAAPVLKNVVGDWTPPIGKFTGDTLNLVTNGLYLTDSNSDGLPDNHAKIGLTCTLTSDAYALGNWLNIASVSTGEEFVVSSTISSGWSVGDRIAVSFRFACAKGTSTGTIYAGVNFNGAAAGSSKLHPIEDFNSDVTKAANWLCYAEGIIPAGTTGLSFAHSRTMSVVGSGASSSIAQCTIRNLTTGGILTA